MNILPTARQGEQFYRQLTADNSTGARVEDITITGVKNLVGAEGEDAVTEVTREVFVPPAQEAFIHDVDGNLTEDASWIYSWDGENRLVAIETSQLAANAGVTRRRIEFTYDGQSRRIAKLVLSWDMSTSAWVIQSSIRFVYDGWNLLAELDATGATLRTYTWGLDLSGSMQGAGGVGGLLFADLQLQSPTSTYAAAYDGNGNVAAYVGMAAGAQSATYEYGAFGETLIADGVAAEAMPFRFSTKYADTETGLCDFGYRFYHPEQGRWLSRDPLEEVGHEALRAALSSEPELFGQNVLDEGTAPLTTEEAAPFFGGNPYLGMRNNALTYIDPDGENPVIPVALVVARKLLLELLKKRVRDRARKIAECESIHLLYSQFNCRGCDPCPSKVEAEGRFRCLASEVLGRVLYLRKKCDYILSGSIARGERGAKAERGHREELRNKIVSLGKCAAASGLQMPTDLVP